MVFESMQRIIAARTSDRTPEVRPAALTAIVQGLANWRRVVPTARGLMIATDCLYFDRTNVSVIVVGGAQNETAVVHDDGGAVDRIVAAGRREANTHRILARVARRYGLLVDDGAITSQPTPIDEIAAMIPIVANASQEAAQSLLHESAPRVYRDIAAVLVEAVNRWNAEALIHRKWLVAGASHRKYSFDLAVSLPDDAMLLVDIVKPDSNSINATIVSNLDVRRRADGSLRQVIVFDEDLEFPSASLSLLASVADTVGSRDFARVLVDQAA